MTQSLPTPEDRLAALATAIAATDRAVMALETSIRMADRLAQPDTALALAMLFGIVGHAVDSLRHCRDLLKAPGGTASMPVHSPRGVASRGDRSSSNSG